MNNERTPPGVPFATRGAPVVENLREALRTTEPRVADSTVGMTAYNALGLLFWGEKPGPATRAEIGRVCWLTLGFPIVEEQLGVAMDKLVALGRVSLDGERYTPRGPCGIVRTRDRSATDDDPGWQGWVIEVASGERLPLDEVLS